MKHQLVRIGRKAKNLFSKAQPVALATVVATSVVLSCMPSTLAEAQNLTPSPRISLTFDDGLQSAIEKAAPILKNHGLTGTNYVITDCVGMGVNGAANTCAADNTKPYMTWEQITQLQNEYGWEIGSHTATHPQLSTDGLNAAQLKTQLEGSKTTLAAHNITANALAFPYGDYDNNVLAQAAKYYTSARGFADTDAPNAYPYNDALLLDQQVQAGAPAPTWSLCTDTTVAGVKACIDNAIANNYWLILTFHNITDTPATDAESYDYSTSDLDQIAAYIQEKQTANAIKSVNISGGLVSGNNNLVAGGSFAGTSTIGTYAVKPSATAWTADSTGITIDNGTNGNFPEAQTSVKMVAGTAAGHLFSPMVAVNPAQSYVLKNFANVSAYTSGELGYYIHEYDAAGNEIGGQWKKAIAKAWVETSSFSYTPTAGTVTASLEVYVTANSGITAYVDNFQWYSTSETDTPPATDTTAPVVTGVTVSSTASSATISWTTDEASTATVNYGTTTAYGQSVTETVANTTHSVTLSGLTASTNYNYQIVAKDAAGNTNDTNTGIFGTVAMADIIAPVISGATATSVTSNSAILTWTTDEDSDSQVTNGTTSTTLDATLTKNHAVALNGLTPDTSYTVQVKSKDAAGNLATSDVTFKTAVAPDVTGPVILTPSATATSDSVTITWSTDELASSRIDLGTTTAYDQFVESLTLAPNAQFTITGLTPDTTYHYQITSVDVAGNVTKSADITIHTTVQGTIVNADVNNDGKVGIKDAIIVSQHWGMQNATHADGDINGDKTVGIKDAILISQNWSQN